MAPFVEANSLSSITQLAGNPPRYPRNPTESQRNSLVLYIARVPGSQDIILTPFKPGLKNVTVEDVASSLYFLHLQRPEDEDLLRTNDPLMEEEADCESEVPPPVPVRKPLPKNPQSELEVPPPVPVRKPLPNNPESESEDPPPVPERKPLPHNSLPVLPLIDERLGGSPPKPPLRWSGLLPKGKVPHATELPHRKPVHQNPSASEAKTPSDIRLLGPRPLQVSEPKVPRNFLPGDENRLLEPAVQYEDRSVRSIASSEKYQGQKPFRPHLSISEVGNNLKDPLILHEVSTKDFSVTIIRRDPTSGAQWNVGFIANQGALNESTTIRGSSPRLKRSGGGVSVSLVTPGYNQFKGMQSIDQSTTTREDTMDSPSNNASCFVRQVVLERSQTSFWDRKVMRGSVDMAGSLQNLRARSNSGSSDIPSRENPQASAERSKPRCYYFSSPWNGRCEFSTGNGGRSLRCKHELPNNPVAATVSELRFNLPSAAIFGSPIHTATDSQGNERVKRSKIQHIRNKLSSHSSQTEEPYRPSPSSYASMYPSDDDEDDPEDEHLDLSLGREAAGGGNRGKRAKLGKIIIHDEGLKMLDLVIAANMGIWWQTYGGC